jgi:hypothetical protein
MANNATTTWRWKGTVSTAWDAANWLNSAGVQIDDYPTGALPTHTVKFLGADLSGTNRCATGPGSATTLLAIEADMDYPDSLSGSSTICFANLTVATVTAKSATTASSGLLTIEGGAIATAVCYDNTRINGGTIGIAKMYDASSVRGGTITGRIEAHDSEQSAIYVDDGKTLTFGEDARIDIFANGILLSQHATATGVALGAPTVMWMRRREATITIGPLTIISGTLKIDTSRAYGFGGNQLL